MNSLHYCNCDNPLWEHSASVTKSNVYIYKAISMYLEYVYVFVIQIYFAKVKNYI